MVPVLMASMHVFQVQFQVELEHLLRELPESGVMLSPVSVHSFS